MGRHRHASTEGLDPRRLAHESVVHVELEGLDLRGVDFRGSRFVHANFENSDLRDTKWDGATLTHGDFNGADLRGSNLLKVIRATHLHTAQAVVLASDVPSNRSEIIHGRYGKRDHTSATVAASSRDNDSYAKARKLRAEDALRDKAEIVFDRFIRNLDQSDKRTAQSMRDEGATRESIEAFLRDRSAVDALSKGMFPFQRAHALDLLQKGSSSEEAKAWIHAYHIPKSDRDAFHQWLNATGRTANLETACEWIDDFGANGTLTRYKRDDSPLSRWNWSWAKDEMIATESEAIAAWYKHQDDIKEGRKIMASKGISARELGSRRSLADFTKVTTAKLVVATTLSFNAVVYAAIHLF